MRRIVLFTNKKGGGKSTAHPRAPWNSGGHGGSGFRRERFFSDFGNVGFAARAPSIRFGSHNHIHAGVTGGSNSSINSIQRTARNQTTQQDSAKATVAGNNATWVILERLYDRTKHQNDSSYSAFDALGPHQPIEAVFVAELHQPVRPPGGHVLRSQFVCTSQM
jgi:hypothetical protein